MRFAAQGLLDQGAVLAGVNLCCSYLWRELSASTSIHLRLTANLMGYEADSSRSAATPLNLPFPEGRQAEQAWLLSDLEADQGRALTCESDFKGDEPSARVWLGDLDSNQD
jgi:hypothetical protein